MVGVVGAAGEVELWGWFPDGVAVGVLAGDPAVLGDELVVHHADEGQLVDVGQPAVDPIGDGVVNLAEIARSVAAGERAAAILGVQRDALTG